MSVRSVPLCYVLMPVGAHHEYPRAEAEAKFVYNRIITPAVRKAFGGADKVTIDRAVDSFRSGTITHEIVANIAAADIVIVDLTGNNPNVLFECGTRYVLRRTGTILLLQNLQTAPFDLSHLRHLKYDIFNPDAAERNLATAIKRALASADTDSPIYEHLTDLSVTYKNSPGSHMPWSEYWDKIVTIAKELRTAKERGTYLPDAIIGLTNGGAAFAEFISYELYYRCPFLSLWNNRDENDHIEHDLNNRIVACLAEFFVKDRRSAPNILIIDDLFGKGTTSNAAVELVKRAIPNSDVRYLPLVSHNIPRLLRSDTLLWKHGAFSFQDQKIKDIHSARYDTFPFGKSTKG